MRLFRLIALFLTLTVGAGAGVLDPCLIGCHEPAPQAAVPSCHEAADAAGTTIAGTADCGHDHTGLEADTPLESRLSAVRFLAQPALAPESSAGAEALRRGPAVSPWYAATLHPHVPPRPHLRL